MPAAPSVLVVEDEALLRLDIVDSLEEDGFRVLGAGDSDEAIAILESRQPIDLVFTDVEMPGQLDGLALSKLVAVRWPTTRIIVTSGRRERSPTFPTARSSFRSLMCMKRSSKRCGRCWLCPDHSRQASISKFSWDTEQQMPEGFRPLRLPGRLLRAA